jgi:hypothetical protein
VLEVVLHKIAGDGGAAERVGVSVVIEAVSPRRLLAGRLI